MNFGPNDAHSNAPPELDLGRVSAAQSFDDEEGGGMDFRRYFYAVLRYKWLVLGLTLVGLVGGVVGSTFVKPVYEARAAVQLPTPRGWQNDPTASPPLVEGIGWIELARSFQVLDDVVRSRRTYLSVAQSSDTTFFAGLDLAASFVPGSYRIERIGGGLVRLSTVDGDVVEEVALGDSLGRNVGLRWQPTELPDGRAIQFRVASLRDAATRLNGSLETFLSKDGSILRFSMRGSDPRAAASLLNDIVTRFIAVATTLKGEKLTTVTRVLGDQLASSRADLTAAETELQRFRVETITLPDQGSPIAPGLSETTNPARNAYFQMRTDRDAVERDRQAIARALSTAGDSARSLAVSLGTIASVRNSRELSASLQALTNRQADLQQLRVAFAAGHPQVRAAETEIRSLQDQVVTQARSLMNDLAASVADLEGRIGTSSREMQQIPVRFTEEARRTRNVEVAQMIYTQLQGSYEQARLAELSATPDVRLLDEAVPPTTPMSDSVTKVLLMGLGGGLFLGIALALLLDIFDTRIRYPDQVTRDLGLPILGALPMLGKGPDGQPNRDDVSALLEATRAIRMALLYAHGTAGSFVTTITSPGPGDGKSFTSANVAKSFSASGRRTILIDADNRRGVLHRAFGVERKPGLMDLLTGNASIDEVVVHLPDAGMDFMPTGTRLAAAPEMLASPKMQQLLVELRTRYQAIIVDSPPLGAGVDPLILASLTGTLVLVLRNGKTDRQFAGARLDALQRLPIRILGAVLNDVSATEGMYRYYSYVAGYRSEDEVESAEEMRKRITSGTR